VGSEGRGGADEGDGRVALREEVGYNVLACSAGGAEEKEVHCAWWWRRLSSCLTLM
jgi:hypothetical protein